MAADRTDKFIEEWLDSVDCPVICVDGTNPVERNVEYIMSRLDLHNIER